MEIPDFDMKILSYIAECKIGRSKQELSDKFGSEALQSVDFLLQRDLLRSYDRDLSPFYRSGSVSSKIPVGNILATAGSSLELKRWKVRNSLSKKQRWIERMIGFISGVLVAVIGGVILQLLVK